MRANMTKQDKDKKKLNKAKRSMARTCPSINKITDEPNR
jgi:hypothetical protein